MGGKKIVYDWVDGSLKRWADDFAKGQSGLNKPGSTLDTKKGSWTHHPPYKEAVKPNKPSRMSRPDIVRDLSATTKLKKIIKRVTGGKRTKPKYTEPTEKVRKKKPDKRMTAKELQERNKKIAAKKKPTPTPTPTPKPKPETKKKTTKKKTTKKKKKDKSVTAPKEDVPF